MIHWKIEQRKVFDISLDDVKSFDCCWKYIRPVTEYSNEKREPILLNRRY